MGQKATRRKFLRGVAAGLPAAAAGGLLAHIGLTAGRGRKGSKFPGDPAVWRSKFLGQARAEKGAVAAVDTLEAPVKVTEVPMVMDISQGPIAVAGPEQGLRPKEADLIRMQKELKRAMEKPIDQRKWIMVIDLRKCIGRRAAVHGCLSGQRHLETRGRHRRHRLRRMHRLPVLPDGMPLRGPLLRLRRRLHRRHAGEAAVRGGEFATRRRSSRTRRRVRRSTAESGPETARARRWATPVSASSASTGWKPVCYRPV
jgi:hypothetical protein